MLTIDTETMNYIAKSTLNAVYLDIGDDVLVGYIPNSFEREELLNASTPKGEEVTYPAWDQVVRVLPAPVSHFFPTCEGEKVTHLSWDQNHTTCKCCLRKRAHDLRGWRWELPMMADEVALIKAILGDEADAIGSQPADDEPMTFMK